MAKPMQEAKWQMEKVVNLVAELSVELDEADYRLGEVEEVDTDEIASLAQRAIVKIEANASEQAIELLQEILKELEK